MYIFFLFSLIMAREEGVSRHRSEKVHVHPAPDRYIY